MKTLQQICAASILGLLLTVSVLAGHIETPAAPAPPPASPTTATSTATTLLLTVLNIIRR